MEGKSGIDEEGNATTVEVLPAASGVEGLRSARNKKQVRKGGLPPLLVKRPLLISGGKLFFISLLLCFSIFLFTIQADDVG